MKKQTPKAYNCSEVLITVIVPVCNDTVENLETCLSSICASTHKKLEIIVADDGSEQSLSQKYKELCSKIADERLQYFHNSHMGVGLARQAGIQISTGQYIAFVDSDDIVAPDMYSHLLALCEKKQADAAYGLLAYTDNQKTNVFRDLTEAEYYQNDIINELISLLLGFNSAGKVMHASVCRALYKKEVIAKHGVRFSPLCFSEDLFFNLNFLINSKYIVTTKKLCYYYKVNTKSVTNKYNSDRFDKTLLVYNELQKWLDAHNIANEKNLCRIAAWFLSQLSVIVKNEVLLNPNKLDSSKRLSLYLNHNSVKSALKSAKIKKPFGLRIFCVLMRLRQKQLLGLAIRLIYNS